MMPAGLREQWRQELLDRFDLLTIRADAGWLIESARELPADVNPWALPGIYIASYDFVKRPEVLRPLEDITGISSSSTKRTRQLPTPIDGPRRKPSRRGAAASSSSQPRRTMETPESSTRSAASGAPATTEILR